MSDSSQKMASLLLDQQRKENATNTTPRASVSPAGPESTAPAATTVSQQRRKSTHRTVTAMNPEQLARKRASDRAAQRAVRSRMKKHLAELQQTVDDLCQADVRDDRIRSLQLENDYYRRFLQQYGLLSAFRQSTVNASTGLDNCVLPELDNASRCHPASSQPVASYASRASLPSTQVPQDGPANTQEKTYRQSQLNNLPSASDPRLSAASSLVPVNSVQDTAAPSSFRVSSHQSPPTQYGLGSKNVPATVPYRHVPQCTTK